MGSIGRVRNRLCSRQRCLHTAGDSSALAGLHHQWSKHRRDRRSPPRPIFCSKSELRHRLPSVPPGAMPWMPGAPFRPPPTVHVSDSHWLSLPKLADRRNRLLNDQCEYSRYIHSQSCHGGVAGIRCIGTARIAQRDIEIDCNHMVDSCHVARRRREHG